MTKTNKKTAAALCCLLLLCALTGCQLALDDMGPNGTGDRLIGVFVTTEALNLFDTEAYLNDNIGQLLSGGNMQRYEGRFYATPQETTAVDEDGNKHTTEDYIFEGLDGISFFAATVPATEDRDSYVASTSDPAITDADLRFVQSDGENSKTLKGTVFVTPDAEPVFHANPVYQSADGSVWLVSGSGIHLGDAMTEGTVFSQTMDESHSVTANGAEKTERFSVSLSFEVMFASEKIIILQMDATNKLLSQAAYAPGSVPDTLTADRDAAYLIAETQVRDEAGEIRIRRGIYDPEDATIEIFCARPDGICEARSSEIIW